MPFQTRIGAVLHERYEIVRIIGQGGYGFIYLAQDQRLAGRYCAVKQVSYDPTFPPAMLQEARDQFMREATILARLAASGRTGCFTTFWEMASTRG